MPLTTMFTRMRKDYESLLQEQVRYDQTVVRRGNLLAAGMNQAAVDRVLPLPQNPYIRTQRVAA